MKIIKLHDWDITPKEAVQLQKELVKKITLQPIKKKVTYIAGADISYSKNDPHLYATVVVLKLPTLDIVEVQQQKGLATFPYVPGLLAFRELPLLCEVFAKLTHSPDVVVCDGQGIAHPRHLGLASHLGLLLNIPTIGCAKTLLVGKNGEVENHVGATSSLIFKEKIVGAALRTRKNVKPVFISPGYLIDLKSSLSVIQQCVTRYRIPEPTRQAHLFVNKMRRKIQSLD